MYNRAKWLKREIWIAESYTHFYPYIFLSLDIPHHLRYNIINKNKLGIIMKVKVSRDKKTQNVTFQTEDFKVVFNSEMYNKIDRGGGYNNSSIQDINKNQWCIKEHQSFGNVVMTHKDKTLKFNLEKIYNQVKR